MTPEDELRQNRLAEDRHLEQLRAIADLKGLLSEVKAMVSIAAGTVIKDPEALRISVDDVIKKAE